MSSHDDDDKTTYNVVVNHEEQYSIWPTDRELPLGWNNAGKAGTKQECLDYIGEVWTDMRPLSLRKHMEEMQRQAASTKDATEATPEEDWNRGPTLVEQLCEGRHPVIASLRPAQTAQAFKECIDRGYVHIKFTETKGGTEFGVRLDKQACDEHQASFSNGTGTVHLEGNLTLDYVKVRCTADIDLTTFAGQGRLSLAETA